MATDVMRVFPFNIAASWMPATWPPHPDRVLSAAWFDISDQLIGGPLHWLFAQSHWTAWPDGFTNVTGLK